MRSPRKSTRRASRELKVPQSTVSKILHKRLRLHPYKLQLVQKLHTEDKETRHAFCGNLQALMENDDDLLAKIIFSDDATFHLSGKVNRYNVSIWGSENPHATLKVERDSPKLNVFCAVSKQIVYGPFIFDGQTVNGRSYLEMLTNWLIPQLAAERHDYIFRKTERCRNGISLFACFSTSTWQTDGLAALDKTTRCSASGPRNHRT